MNSKLPLSSFFPSSNCIRDGHILRMFYLTRMCVSLLTSDFTLDPLEYGWKEKNGYLLPHKFLNDIPPDFVITCSCKNCKGRCKCKSVGMLCTKYCICQASQICENLHI